MTGQEVGARAATVAPGDSAGDAGGTAPNDFPLQPPRPPGPGETYKMFGMPYSSEVGSSGMDWLVLTDYGWRAMKVSHALFAEIIVA